MGSEGWGEFEGPVHEVDLDEFWMDETPVTNSQFAKFVQATSYRTEAEKFGEAWGYDQGEYKLISALCWQSYNLAHRGDHPVVLVTWNDAKAYAKWAGKRLPTEAEWEKAAQSGKIEQLYPWGNQTPNGTQSNFAKTASDIAPTTSVKQFSANEYGLYDMVGNVWQWCEDTFEPTFYADSPRHNPLALKDDLLKVRRGGSWNVIQPFRLRSANRGAMSATSAVPNVGFRCCLSAKS